MNRRGLLRLAGALGSVGLLQHGLTLAWGEAWAQAKSPKGKGGEKKGPPPPAEPPKPPEVQEPEVHWPTDLTKLKGLEVDHIPLLEVKTPEGREESLDLSIRVGKTLHEMHPAHFLRWLQISVDDVKLCEMNFQADGLVPRWQLTIRRRPSIQITVKVECNRHGIWANRLVL
jgi:desulfoferrodoxin (superoxide reductase-like protein)